MTFARQDGPPHHSADATLPRNEFFVFLAFARFPQLLHDVLVDNFNIIDIS